MPIYPTTPRNLNSQALLRALARRKGRTGRFFNSSAGKAAFSSATQLAQALMESRNEAMQGMLSGLLQPDAEDSGFAGRRSPVTTASSFRQLLGNTIESLVTEALTRRKVTTSSYESDRSREAQASWNLSRSQQEAMLARIVQRGTRNL